MSQLKLKGATSGDVTLKCADVAGTTTATFPATTGNVVTTGDSGTITETMMGTNSVNTGELVNLAVTQGKIANEAIDEAKLQVSNAPTNGYVLTARSSNTGGMTWEEIATPTSFGNITVAGMHLGNGNANAHNTNTVLGVVAGENLTSTGFYNVCIGYEGGRGVTTGDQNTLIGYRTGTATFTGHDNVGIGNEALQDCTSGYHNVCVGRETGQNLTSGYGNTFLGERAGYAGIVTGYRNVGIGVYAAASLTSGYENVCIGLNAGANMTTALSNVCIGEGTGLGLVGGANNTFLGHGAGSTGSPSGSVTGNHNVVLGNNNVTDIWCADTSISSSDQRDKADITDFTHGLDWVTQMRPVTYKWDKRSWYVDWDANPDTDLLTVTADGTHKKDRVNIGLLAQDIQAIEQADGFATNGDNELICRTTDDGTQISLKYERIVPVLINAIKELKAEVDTLKTKVAALEAG